MNARMALILGLTISLAGCAASIPRGGGGGSEGGRQGNTEQDPSQVAPAPGGGGGGGGGSEGGRQGNPQSGSTRD